jgi:hypothetical protein
VCKQLFRTKTGAISEENVLTNYSGHIYLLTLEVTAWNELIKQVGISLEQFGRGLPRAAWNMHFTPLRGGQQTRSNSPNVFTAVPILNNSNGSGFQRQVFSLGASLEVDGL